MAEKPRGRVGWYRLPKSGAAYHGTVPDGAEVLDGPPTVEPPAPPPVSASKPAWVAWAVSQGWSPEDAERKTKKALVAELGQHPVTSGESGEAVGAEVPGADLGPDLAQGGAIPAGSFLVGEQGIEHFTVPEGGGHIVGHEDGS